MKTIIVDDERWAREQMEDELCNENDIEIVGMFADPKEALEYAKNNPVEFALLDVRMTGMDGLELGRSLRDFNQNIIIIYVSSYPEHFSEAYRNVRADYYMLKPYSTEDVQDVLARVRLLSKRNKKRIQIRTFGRFDLFVDEQVVLFKNTKAKELLALCVDRKGGNVSLEEAIDKLWEGSPVNENIKTRYRKAVAYLNALFAEYSLPDIFESGYGNCHINIEKVECDYFEYLTNNKKPQYMGEYMHEYSWAEETAAWLDMQIHKENYI